MSRAVAPKDELRLNGISDADVSDWTKNVTAVLESPRARARFSHFMDTTHLKYGKRHLQFWDRCEAFLIEAKKRNRDERALKAEALKLLDIAEKDAHLDSGRMRALRQNLQSDRVERVVKGVAEAKADALLLFKKEFEPFKARLSREKKLTLDGDSGQKPKPSKIQG